MRTTEKEIVGGARVPAGPRGNVVLGCVGDVYRDPQRYELDLVPGRRIEPMASAALRPRDGVWMTARPRRGVG